MCGLVYLFTAIFGSGVEHLRRNKVDREAKDRAIQRSIRGQNPLGIYYDWQGRERSLTTGQQVTVDRENGHIRLKEAGANGKVLRDYTQEKIDEEVKRNAKKPNGKIAILQYEWDQLRYMWEHKFYGYDPRNGEWHNCVLFMPIYVHCKTGRLCYSSLNYKQADNKREKELENILKEKFPEYNDLKYLSICGPDLYIDLLTGTILDYKDRETAFKYDVKECPEKIWIVGKLYENTEKRIVKVTHKIPKEQGDVIIEEYNKRVKNGQIKPLKTGWEVLFM